MRKKFVLLVALVTGMIACEKNDLTTLKNLKQGQLSPKKTISDSIGYWHNASLNVTYKTAIKNNSHRSLSTKTDYKIVRQNIMNALNRQSPSQFTMAEMTTIASKIRSYTYSNWNREWRNSNSKPAEN